MKVRNMFNFFTAGDGAVKSSISYAAIFLLMFLFCISGVAQATQNYTYSKERIKARISKSGLNRISIAPYRLKQVVGDETKYKIKTEERGGNLYIMPQGVVGDKIELSIKNDIDQTQDIELLVSNISGQTIIIKPNKSKPQISSQPAKQEMLEHMIAGIKGKYYVQKSNLVLNEDSQLRVRLVNTYRYQNLSGYIFSLENKRRGVLNVSKEHIDKIIPGNSWVLASDKDYQIKRRGKTLVYTICENQGGINL